MSTLFPPFDPDRTPRRLRFRSISFRVLLPNLVTLLAMCAGLTGIRMAIEGRMELAVGAIVLAAVLDAVDGRLARMLKGTSRFGAELDSLADFMNFGVVPALMLYFWGLIDIRNIGWIASLVFAMSAALRLARFNVMLDDPNKPAYTANFFTGIPAPAGAIAALLPIYLNFLGVPKIPTVLVALYVVGIGLLMVSTIPTFSGKKLGQRIPREKVLPIVLGGITLIALLISYPFEFLTLATLIYLGLIPYGVMRFRAMRRDHETSAATDQSGEMVMTSGSIDDESRPERLN